MSDDPASIYGLRWEIRRSLIERLRIRWDAMGDMANQQRYEASVQISFMMDELEGWQATMQKADRDIAELRDRLEVEESAVNHLHTDRNNLRLEVERLRDERDEARRELCYWWDYSKRDWKFANGHKATPTAVEWADISGWDCFKEKP